MAEVVACSRCSCSEFILLSDNSVQCGSCGLLQLLPNGKRRPLPDRRQGYCIKLEWRDRGLNALPWESRPVGHTFYLHINFYDEACTKVGEVFADIGKTPSSLQQLVAAACIVVSVAIQCGAPLEELLKSQPRYDPSPDFPDGEHFTILGMILQAIVDKYWEKENADHSSITD